MNRLELEEWTARRDQEDDRLYERYGKVLESEHTGEFVAINADGELIISQDELTVAIQASDRFGAGNFAFRRIGADAEIDQRTFVR